MLAIIGFGDHVVRNILPVINGLQFVEVKYVLVTRPEKYKSSYPQYNFVDDLDLIINDNQISRIYIACPIASHMKYAKKAILSGKHVLCEKILTCNYLDTKELIDLAVNQNVNLQEVVIFEHHKQMLHVRKAISERQSNKLIKASVSFQIPHLNSNNIRYDKSQGGGALLDVGFYPLSYLLSLFGMPNNIFSIVYGNESYDVDLIGTALLKYQEFYATADWGIGRFYKNELCLEYENEIITVERPISKPNNLKTKIRFSLNNGECKETIIESDDHFSNIFREFYSLNSPNLEELKMILLRAELINIVDKNQYNAK